jgi:hypothetical protein
MSFFKIWGLLAITSGVMVSGCSSRSSTEIACENLEIKNCSKNVLNYEINKRIEQHLEQQSAEINLKLTAVNTKINPLVTKTFLVDINQYQDIKSLTSSFSIDPGKKLESVKVFAFSAYLPSSNKGRLHHLDRLELTIREGSKGSTKYKRVKDLCDSILAAPCKVNYTGVLDGVWTNKEGESRVIVGWIDYEDIAVVPFLLADLKNAVREQARKSIFMIINEKNSAITWQQIEVEVSRAVSEIK